MKDHFPFLPKDEIFFIDSCAFGLDVYSKRAMVGGNRLSVDYLKEETARLRRLTDKLSHMDNWTTIKEVIEEFKKGIENCLRLQKRIYFGPLISALGEAVDERNKGYELLKHPGRNATENLTDRLSSKVEILLPQVEQVFKRAGGKTNKDNTDCKLVATALAYAEAEPVGIFSHDYPLLVTFAYCAEHMTPPLKNTFVLEEETQRKITSKRYLRRKYNFVEDIQRYDD